MDIMRQLGDVKDDAIRTTIAQSVGMAMQHQIFADQAVRAKQDQAAMIHSETARLLSAAAQALIDVYSVESEGTDPDEGKAPPEPAKVVRAIRRGVKK